MENELINQPSKTLERILLSIIRWGAYVSLLTPLIVVDDFFYSFVVPKTIYFRIIVEIILATYLILILSFPKYRPKINALSVSVFVFILISIATSVLGVDPQRSFWSVYERETGLFTLLHFYAFFVVLSNVFKDKKDWGKLFFVSIVIGVICCLGVVSASSIAKGGGTIGNTSFLASYLLFNVFFAIALLVEHKFSGLGIFAIVSLLIMIPILLTSTARGAIVSFFGGLFLLFIGLLFFSGKKKLKIIAIIIPLILIGLGMFLFFYFPTVRNFVISSLNDMKARYIVWEMAWTGVLEKPILGWGLENFNVVFGKYFNPKLFLAEYGGEVWFDRAHNIILDTLINSGIVGLISYLSVFCISIFLLLKKCFVENKERIGVNLVIISLLVAYFVQNLLVFDLISSFVTFFLVLAFVDSLTQKEDLEESKSFVINKFSKKLCYVLIFILTSSCFYFGNIQPANSAINTSGMIMSNNLTEKIEFYEKSLNGFRYNNETNRYFILDLVRESLNTKEEKAVLEKAMVLAEREALIDIDDNNLSLRPYIVLAKVYISSFRITKDNYYLDLAERVLRETIELSPGNQQGYWLLSDVKYKKGDFVSSDSLLRMAIDLEPRHNDSYWYLISSYMLEERYEEALSIVKEHENKGFNWKEGTSGFQSVISIYESLKDYEAASLLYKELLISSPDDAGLWFKLAISLFNVGDKESAKEAAQRAVQLNPALNDQVSDLLKVLLQ